MPFILNLFSPLSYLLFGSLHADFLYYGFLDNLLSKFNPSFFLFLIYSILATSNTQIIVLFYKCSEIELKKLFQTFFHTNLSNQSIIFHLKVKSPPFLKLQSHILQIFQIFYIILYFTYF